MKTARGRTEKNRKGDSQTKLSLGEDHPASVGRALEKHPVDLHWLAGNINHLHTGFSIRGDDLGAPSSFKQHANSLIGSDCDTIEIPGKASARGGSR